MDSRNVSFYPFRAVAFVAAVFVFQNTYAIAKDTRKLRKKNVQRITATDGNEIRS
jgi:hypothetical protein